MSNKWIMGLSSVLDAVNQRNQKKEDFTRWLIQATGALPSEASVMKGIPATKEEGLAQEKLTGQPLFQSNRQPVQPVAELYGKKFYTPGMKPRELFNQELSRSKLNEFRQGAGTREKQNLFQKLQAETGSRELQNRQSLIDEYGLIPTDVTDFINAKVNQQLAPYIKGYSTNYTDPKKMQEQIEPLRLAFTIKATKDAMSKYWAMVPEEYKKTHKYEEWEDKINTFLGDVTGGIEDKTDKNGGDITTTQPKGEFGRKAGLFIKEAPKRLQKSGASMNESLYNNLETMLSTILGTNVPVNKAVPDLFRKSVPIGTNVTMPYVLGEKFGQAQSGKVDKSLEWLFKLLNDIKNRKNAGAGAQPLFK